MTIRDKVREWLGIEGVIDVVAAIQVEQGANHDDLKAQLDSIETHLLFLRAEHKPHQRIRAGASFIDYETSQQAALNEFPKET